MGKFFDCMIKVILNIAANKKNLAVVQTVESPIHFLTGSSSGI